MTPTSALRSGDADRMLRSMLAVVQNDVGQRGLKRDRASNLVTATLGDFEAACEKLAGDAPGWVLIVTGFYIPSSTPPAAETDGPLGALFLARVLGDMGVPCAIATDVWAMPALQAGRRLIGRESSIPLIHLPAHGDCVDSSQYVATVLAPLAPGPIRCVLTIERVGPCHTMASFLQTAVGSAGEELVDFLTEVPEAEQDRCRTMRGLDVTAINSPAHWLVEHARAAGIATIGIGDGGNEIGMGKIPWEVIRRNIAGGGRIACRVPVDHLLVVGVSNWGGYALAAGVALLKNRVDLTSSFDAKAERWLLDRLVEAGPLVDGVVGRPKGSVDGLEWHTHERVMTELAGLLGAWWR